MKRIYLIVFAAFAFILLSCSRDEETLPGKEGAPVIDLPEGANRGEIIVKFKPEVASRLNQIHTRSGGTVMTRSGISDIDAVLERIGTYKLERVFPVDKRTEQRTQQAGLSLWYVVHFDKNMDLEQVSKDLARVSDVAKVQFSHNVQRSYDPRIRPVVVNKQGMKRLKVAKRAEDVPLFDDPGLPWQWGYVNDGSALAPGEKNDREEEVVPAVGGVDVNCREAWQWCKGDPSIIVAVMDEGVMWNHPDLKANMWVNEAETYASQDDADGNGYAGDRYGYNFVSDMGFISFDDLNDSGHGTHVAGTIAAVNGNNEGVCGIAGGDGSPNSGVKIMSCQIFSGENGSTFYQEAQAIKYAADNGAVILQCSWGYNSGRANGLYYNPLGFTSDEDWIDACPLEKEALDYFIHNAGSPNGVIDGGIVIFAGGNEYANMAGYPGAYPDYISVASVAADGTPSSYTNYNTGIRIAAPGGDSDYHKSEKGNILSTIPPLEGEYYGYMQGTSMACPHVSGVVALGLSYAAKLHKHFRAEDFKRIVLESVSPIEGYFTEPKVYYTDYISFGSVAPMQMEPSAYAGKMGSGLIDAGKLLKAIEDNGMEMTVFNVYVAENQETKVNYSRYFTNGEKLTFTCTVEDGSVAQMTTTDQVTFTIKGLKSGSTKATIKASNNTEKSFYITVRKNSGWL